MRRVIAFVAALWCVAVAASAPAEVFHVEGHVTSGSAPWTNNLFDERDGPLLGFPFHAAPVPYTGVLTIDQANSHASFQVSIDSGIGDPAYGNLYLVDLETGRIVEQAYMPTTYRLIDNLFDGIVRNDAAALTIAYRSPTRAEQWTTSFHLSLDRMSGRGEWIWIHGPADVCVDGKCPPSLPPENARGTIAEFHVVPEPGTLALTLSAAVPVMIRSSCSRNPRRRYGSRRGAAR